MMMFRVVSRAPPSSFNITATARRMVTSTCTLRGSSCGVVTNQKRFQSSSSGLKDSYDYIKVDLNHKVHTNNKDETERKTCIGIIQLNRPKTLNALCDALFDDLIHATQALTTNQNDDVDVGCILLTSSSPKAFAAGADISEMAPRTFDVAYKQDLFSQWQQLAHNVGVPVVAAVDGYALGGGCELALMCDIIVAGERAQFAQPEINLGIIPGAGGTQRLTRAIGKSKAMHMCLTGEFMNAQEAWQSGLVAKVYPSDELLEKTIDMGHVIASKSRISSMMVKECVNTSDNVSLQEGLHFERRMFHSLFATHDQKEGMTAFLQKRTPNFQNK